MERIFKIQQELAVDKTERQSNYNYRTLPATLNALLPKLAENGLIMTLPCETEQRSNGTYVIATCTVYDAKTGDEIISAEYPTLDQNAMIKGGQGTGAAATYAKKGAIDSVFLLDAANPDLPDLDNHDGLQRLANGNEDKAARDYEQRIAVVISAFADAKNVDELKSIKAANPDVMNDPRVKDAARTAYAAVNNH